jgi:hypothetical protein
MNAETRSHADRGIPLRTLRPFRISAILSCPVRSILPVRCTPLQPWSGRQPGEGWRVDYLLEIDAATTDALRHRDFLSSLEAPPVPFLRDRY